MPDFKIYCYQSEIPAWFPIMKRQVYINTWHGGGAYKRVGAAYQKETPGKQIARKLHEKYLVHMYQVQTHLQN